MNPALPSRVLVVRVGALGDTLMVTPLVRALGCKAPAAEVDFLCSEPAAPLLERNIHLARVFGLKHRNLPMALSPEKHRLVRRLRERRYDCAVLLESAPRYRALVERARPARILGFDTTPFDPGRHAIENNLRVAGFDEGDAGGLDMDLPLGPDERESARRLLSGLAAPRVGIHIGYGPRGRKKGQSTRLRGWSLDAFARLLRLTAGLGAAIVVTGSAEDRDDAEAVCRGMGDSRIRVLAGRTGVMDLAAVIAGLDLLVSLDSGPAHMAAALATPLVVIWGPGIYAQTRPVSSRAPVRILRHPVPCAPCYGTPRMKSCRRNICMEQITPEDVFEEIRGLLAV